MAASGWEAGTLSRIAFAVLLDREVEPGGQRGRHGMLAGFKPQISAAYSRIVRSEENQPTRETFKMLDRHQASLCFQLASTALCVLQYASKSAAIMK